MPGHGEVPGHAGGQTSQGCAECAAGQTDFGWTDNRAIQYGITDSGMAAQSQNERVVLEHSENSSGNAGTTYEIPGEFVDPNLGETQMLNEGRTILQLDETIPSTSASPPSDFSPIEFTPDLGLSQPRDVSPVVNRELSKELFDWSQQDTAVVRSINQRQNPVQRVANLNFFVESPEQNNKQSTQKASLNQPASTEWTSETVNGN